MSIKELQQQTTVNVQEKANLIWAIAEESGDGSLIRSIRLIRRATPNDD